MFETILNVIRIAADIVIIVCAVKLVRKNRKWTEVVQMSKEEIMYGLIKIAMLNYLFIVPLSKFLADWSIRLEEKRARSKAKKSINEVRRWTKKKGNLSNCCDSLSLNR